MQSSQLSLILPPLIKYRLRVTVGIREGMVRFRFRIRRLALRMRRSPFPRILRDRCCVAFGGRGQLQLGGAGQHALEADSDALDDGEQHGAADGAVPRRLVAAADGQGAACEKACDDGVVTVAAR